jgi:hypothetical protein
MIIRLSPPLCLVFALSGATADAAGTAQSLQAIKAVGKQAAGNEAAQAAYRRLIKADAKVLPEILKAFDGANPLAVNWLRNAVESIADRTVKAGGKLPVAELEAFIRNRKQDPRARRLAFEWLRTVDAKRAAKLVPTFLLDPSAELRREAVAKLIGDSKKLDPKSQKPLLVATLRTALTGAVDDDQVKAIVKPLRTLGVKVDLQRHFGFLTAWHIIGPFDNKGGKGFDVAYPPEKAKAVNLKAEYDGQLGKVKWQPVETNDPYGIVDIAKSLKNYKGSAMYAVTEFHAERPREVQFRLGTPNSWKLWVNGRLLFAREEYHRGMAIDQYRVMAKLKPGRNVVLLKILQNEQTEDWAQRYRYQIRVCDGAGSAILPVKTTATSADDSRRN